MADNNETVSNQQQILELTTDIVSAYASNNNISTNELADLVDTIHGKLSGIAGGGSGTKPRPKPAVPVKRSVTNDYIICLEDGAKLKMLKRYLRTHYKMTPEEYRERWNLPADYPMVAPGYAKKRSEFAKKIGLGKKGGRKKKSAKSK